MSVASHPDPTPADPYPAPAHPPEPPPAAPAEPVGVPSAPSELPSEGEPLGVPPDLPSEIPSSPARPQSWASSYRPPGQSSIVAKHRMPGARGADVGHRGSSDHRRGRPGDAKPYRAADARGLRPVLVPAGPWPSPLSHIGLASHRNAIMWRSSCRPRTEAKSPVRYELKRSNLAMAAACAAGRRLRVKSANCTTLRNLIMLLAPVGAFIIGLFLGFIAGFQRPKFNEKSAMALIFILGMPAIYLLIIGGEVGIFVILVIGLLITYLSLLIGTLVGNWLGKFLGRRVS